MGGQATLHLFCGKMASGKSTLAARIAAESGGVLLAEDALLAGLYPDEIVDVPSYAQRAGRIGKTLRAHLVALLGRGLTLVLDFPANTPRQRAWLIGLAREAGVRHELHFLDLPDELCRARLADRVAISPERRATDTPAMFDAMTRHFVPPGAAEGCEVIVHGIDRPRGH